MSANVFPPTSGGSTSAAVADKFFRATAAGTYTLTLPSGTYDVTGENLQTTVVINSLNYDSGTVKFYIASANPSVTFTSVYDTTTWTARITNTSGNQPNAIDFGNGLYVAGGTSGSMYTSTDGITWTSRASQHASNVIRGIAYSAEFTGPHKWSSTSIGSYLTISTDGITWVYGGDYSGRFGTSTIVWGITFGMGFWVAVGGGGTIATATNNTNGSTWTTRSSGTANTIYNVAAGPIGFVAGSQGGVIYSTNGTSWSFLSSGGINSTINYYGVGYGNGIYFACGDSGRLFTSTNLTSWTERTTGLTSALWDVTFGGGQYIVHGDNGQLASSTNGSTWTIRSSGQSHTLFESAYGSTGGFVAVGSSTVAIQGTDIKPFGEQILTFSYKGELINLV